MGMGSFSFQALLKHLLALGLWHEGGPDSRSARSFMSALNEDTDFRLSSGSVLRAGLNLLIFSI